MCLEDDKFVTLDLELREIYSVSWGFDTGRFLKDRFNSISFPYCSSSACSVV